MEIPVDVLDTLKCSQCEEYLSCGPVHVRLDNKAVCGRCVIPDEPVTHSHQYEALAQFFSFPCMHHEAGCNEELSFSLQGQPHEAECAYRPYVCPIAGPDPCEWLGRRSQLLAHCRSEHPEQVVENGHVLEHDVSQSSQRTFLLILGHFLFLLHAKVCVTSRKIFHAVRYLGDPTRAGDFGYNLRITRRDESIVKSGSVAPEGCRAIQEDIALTVDINSLLGVLGGFDGTCFTITVKELEKDSEKDSKNSEKGSEKGQESPEEKAIACWVKVKDVQEEKKTECAKGCGKLVSAFVYRDGSGWWCKDCVPKFRTCKNSKMGCPFDDIEYKCRGHEHYLCQYSTKCTISRCRQSIIPGMLLEHWLLSHRDISYDSDAVWRCAPGFMIQTCLINFGGGMALCQYSMIMSQLALWIHTGMRSEQLHIFSCTVQVTDVRTKQSISYTTKNSLYNDECDWHIRMDVRDLVGNYKDFDIKIAIDCI